MKLGKLYGNPIDCLRDTLDTVRERGNYSRYSPGSYIALDNYVNGIDALHEPATPHYPVPAIRHVVEILPDRVLLWDNTHWTDAAIWLAYDVDWTF